jgi:hypothetical protein
LSDFPKTSADVKPHGVTADENATASSADTARRQGTPSPFNLDDPGSYKAWRDAKLANYPQSVAELLVPVQNPNELTDAEYQAILSRCLKANMAVYQVQAGYPVDKETIKSLCRRFSLYSLDKNLYADDDGISSLQVSTREQQHEYIPYSENAINWHTDGYYNPPRRTIRGMLLHCASAAAAGGDNAFLDHEIVYILMRDADPVYIHAFMQPDAMTIPANIQDGVQIRAAQTGPVFSITTEGDLHMRYTARTRSIEWKSDPATQAAVKCLEELLRADLPQVFHHRMLPGQGIISNNVLHSRTRFKNGDAQDQNRLVYRARFYERVAGTSFRSQ